MLSRGHSDRSYSFELGFTKANRYVGRAIALVEMNQYNVSNQRRQTNFNPKLLPFNRPLHLNCSAAIAFIQLQAKS
jgi:hypothetical protein